MRGYAEQPHRLQPTRVGGVAGVWKDQVSQKHQLFSRLEAAAYHVAVRAKHTDHHPAQGPGASRWKVPPYIYMLPHRWDHRASPGNLDAEPCRFVGPSPIDLTPQWDGLYHSNVSFPRANPAPVVLQFQSLLRGKEFHQLPKTTTDE